MALFEVLDVFALAAPRVDEGGSLHEAVDVDGARFGF
jgi:hypothetical protein